MRQVAGVAALVVLLSGAAVTHLVYPGNGDGPRWEAGEDGHSLLVDSLATQQPVRVISGALSLLPPQEGTDAALLLFADNRVPSVEEVNRVRAFLLAGGVLIMAADSPASDPWFDGLGIVPPQGEMVVVADDGVTCIPVQTSAGSLCMPSPSAFGEDEVGQTHPIATHRSTRDTYFDLDRDGRLSLHDQGPARPVMVVVWPYGDGTVMGIADGDLWRNKIVRDDPTNLEAVLRMVDGAKIVYVDGTGSLPPGASTQLVMQVLSTGRSEQIAIIMTFSAIVALAAAVAPRARQWEVHRPDDMVEDGQVETYLKNLRFE